jgi:uncharacterized protein (TIGR01619 family)
MKEKMRTLLMIVLVGFLPGCTDNTMNTKQNSEGDEHWEFFPCSMGDDQAFIFLNVGINKSIVNAPKHLAKLRLAYKAPRPNGLPTKEEFEPVSKIEDRIENFSKAKNDWYVGRVTVSGHRIFYIYTGRTEENWNDFVTALSDESGYSIYLSYNNDPEHRGYREDLYPTPDDWQVIMDLKVIEVLKKQGDDGSAVRKIDHWIYFDDKTSAADFVKWAEKDRFTEEAKYSHTTDDGKYCVRLFHNGTIELGDITSHTIALRRKADEFGGEYDGWETPVTKPEDNKAMQETPGGEPDG